MADERRASSEKIRSNASGSEAVRLYFEPVVGSSRTISTFKTKYSSLAQSVEHAAVNRVVVGSSPTGGAKKKRQFSTEDCRFFLYSYLFTFHSYLFTKKLSFPDKR